MRNRHPGICYRCGKPVAAGDGHFERHKGGWRVQHATCAIEARKPAILFNCPHCGKQIPTPEEADLFRLAGVKWIEPELRNVQVAP